jgi:predicted Zn-dependent protease
VEKKSASTTKPPLSPPPAAAAPVVEKKSASTTKPPLSFGEIDRAIEAGQLATAKTLLKDMIRTYPDNPGAYFRMGQIFAREDMYSEAREQLNKAKNIDPSLRFAAVGKFQELYNEMLAMEKMSKLPGRE